MATSEKIGARRLVVGAHYGVKDFIAQRVTAVILVVYTLVLGIMALFTPAFTYETWVGLFNFRTGAFPTGQMLATLAVIATAYHAWIGVRDIWMDYVKPVGLRIVLHVFTLVWLTGCAGWAIQVLWRL